MAIYEISDDGLHCLEETSFEKEGLREREDLQRLIRDHVKISVPDTLVIAEEFGEWEDSRRRIDLLGLDKDANLVVIELKRTEDGGHMELQAVRYAAMVSTMTFEKIVDVHRRYLQKLGGTDDAEASILEFLGWEEPNEDAFGEDVRIILASAEFSKELTTAVMWLNDHELDIRCIRLKPYTLDGRVLIDAQQIIPLPEVETYQVQIREKGKRERRERAERYEIRRRFWTGLLDRARSKTDLHANISPSEYTWIATSAGMRGLSFVYANTQHKGRVELYIDRGAGREAENKAIFDRLFAVRETIEADFGEALEWQRLDGKQACRIKKSITTGGYRDSEQDWPAIQDAMIDAMIRLHQALESHIAKLKLEPVERQLQER